MLPWQQLLKNLPVTKLIQDHMILNLQVCVYTYNELLLLVIINRSSVSSSTLHDEVEDDEGEVEQFGRHHL